MTEYEKLMLSMQAKLLLGMALLLQKTHPAQRNPAVIDRVVLEFSKHAQQLAERIDSIEVDHQ